MKPLSYKPISASLVLFHNSPLEIERVIQCFLDGCEGTLYVVDNSSTPLEHDLFRHSRVHYIYSDQNIGFGSAHNLAISKIDAKSFVHLIINPDIVFEKNVLPDLINFLELNHKVGAVMPRINYPDGSLQRLCKLLPTPLDLIFRRFIPSQSLKYRINKRYEIHGLSQNFPTSVPSLSACFLLVRTSIIKNIGGFDERFFMYMEDVDLVRRIGEVSDTVYFPSVRVTHAYGRGSYTNRKLLGYHLRSAVKYFNKWGWIFDNYRKNRNKSILLHIKRSNKIS